MGPKKVRDNSRPKRKTVRTTIALKKEIIAKFESGARVSSLATEYRMPRSTISTVIKNREAIKGADVAKGVKALTKQRSQTLEQVEKLLLIWINERQFAGDIVSEAIICEKAKRLHADLLRRTPGTSADGSETFKASRGWFDKFKRRSGIRRVGRNGEASSAVENVAEEFVCDFRDYVEAEGFSPQQVFNCDETGLFWKKMPSRTFIAQEEKSLPGHRSMTDRLSLLLCANASGDLKLKPLLVYHSENPGVFKKNNVMKSRLNVMWRANSKAWVTSQFFTEWVNEEFGPSVKKYLEVKGLPLKAILVVDSASAHPPGLEDDLLPEFSFITVKFLPPNTASLIQPMDQQVMSSFKRLYTKALFQRCYEVTSSTELTLREFWRSHFNILHCLSLIDKAWGEVSYRTLNSAWRKLWPEAVTQWDFEGFGIEPWFVLEDIVSLGKSMGLEVSEGDVERLVEEHKEELSAEELLEHQWEQQQTSSSEDEGREGAPTALIQDICAKWVEVQSFVEKYHPDKAATSRSVNAMNDLTMSHFRNILKRRQKQASLDRFLVKLEPGECQAVSERKRERSPEEWLLDDFMDGDAAPLGQQILSLQVK